MGKQRQLLLKPTEVELGLQVGVEFDNNNNTHQNLLPMSQEKEEQQQEPHQNLQKRSIIKKSLCNT